MYRSANRFFVVGFTIFLLCVFGCANELVQPNAKNDWAERCTDWDDWDKPAPAFRIFGNSYYVGTCGISAILITSDNGHIVIDGGTEAGANVIMKNIEALGFSMVDVKVLLHSHEHFDHVAGLNTLQEASGARLLASVEAAPVLRTGVNSAHDPQAGMHAPFPAAQVDGLVREGEAVKLGSLSLYPIATPGHTPGALSWQWNSCEKERCVSIVYADSLSPVSGKDYHFSEHLEYVNVYRTGLDKLASLDCDILITPHPSASNMRGRLFSRNRLIDQEACRVYAATVSKRLNERLAKEGHNSL